MNMEEILSKVKSPFTTEFIKELIIDYLNSESINHFMQIEKNSQTAVPNEYVKYLDFSNIDTNSWGNWVLLNKDFNTNDIKHRLYINAKGENKAEIITQFLAECELSELPYLFKYSKVDSMGDDEIVFATDDDTLSKTLELLSKITDPMELGAPLRIAGKYNEKIGIADEDTQTRGGFSYTETRLRRIPSALKKYMLDNYDTFSKYCDEEERETLNAIKDYFNEELDDYYKYESDSQAEIELLESHISTGLSECLTIDNLKSAFKAAIADNPEILDEMVKDFIEVCKHCEISSNIIYSSETEEKLKNFDSISL